MAEKFKVFHTVEKFMGLDGDWWQLDGLDFATKKISYFYQNKHSVFDILSRDN